MIQRRQTLHLLIVTALLVSMLFFNLATYTLTSSSSEPATTTLGDGTIVRSTVVGNDEVAFRVWGLYSNGVQFQDLTHFSVLVILTIAASFVTIFLYRKLWVQVRVCLALLALLLGIVIYIVMYIYKLSEMLPEYAVKYSVADLFPLFAMVFVYLAYRGIARDIALLRSVDRIR